DGEVGQPLGVGEVRRSFQGAVDEQRPQIGEVPPALLAQLLLLRRKRHGPAPYRASPRGGKPGGAYDSRNCHHRGRTRPMDKAALQSLQTPLKDQYRSEPDAARITLRAEGRLGEEAVSCTVEPGRARGRAGPPPATCRAGMDRCSAGLLLHTRDPGPC